MFSDRHLVRSERLPGTWSWEIFRKSKPLVVRLYGENFSSEAAAKLAGEKALRELLDDPAGEARRSEFVSRHSDPFCANCNWPMSLARRLPAGRSVARTVRLSMRPLRSR